ncbi:hypothetical protein Acr_15g0016660 [Actinidia rufa]|uniref:Uncharacterized protein n=1 Tax=Actinidia rufa TaxID=165716 RepID=A0A7J0FYP9_9ERIC|nr:hypothetical protein Acr_15g0016660 [Actinidia rufa]
MSAAKSSVKKRVSESETLKSEKVKRVTVEDEFDLDLSNDIKGIMSALQQIRAKAQKDGQKKNEETISSVASEIKSKLDELRNKFEKESRFNSKFMFSIVRQSLAKALSKSSKECENLLKNETAKYQALHEKFCKEKAAHLHALKGFSVLAKSYAEGDIFLSTEHFAPPTHTLDYTFDSNLVPLKFFTGLRKFSLCFLLNEAPDDLEHCSLMSSVFCTSFLV